MFQRIKDATVKGALESSELPRRVPGTQRIEVSFFLGLALEDIRDARAEIAMRDEENEQLRLQVISIRSGPTHLDCHKRIAELYSRNEFNEAKIAALRAERDRYKAALERIPDCIQGESSIEDSMDAALDLVTEALAPLETA